MVKKSDIKKWQELESDGWESLLLGNGASIAIDKGFSYGTLYEVAKEEESFEDIKKIFDKLKTEDFERALLACWYAKVVNDSLGQSCKKISCAYESIRAALIEAVKKVHPSHSKVSGDLERVSEFMSGFRVVFSLNYDLVVYWAMMVGNRRNPYSFKDCFLKDGVFDDNIDYIRRKYAPRAGSKDTLVFYPHGNMVLAEDFFKGEAKVKVSYSGDDWGDLLTTIEQYWKDGDLKPVFVSEGDSSEKLSSIGRSKYLRTVYERLIPSRVGQSLVVYGWGMQENDRHILDAIKLSAVQRMAVSVFRSEKGSEKALEYCRHVKDSLEKADIDVEPEFFWSDSAGCWNNPKEG